MDHRIHHVRCHGRDQGRGRGVGVVESGEPGESGESGESGELMASRIGRLLEIAVAHGFRSLVLGARGCGACGNDAGIVARHFHTALEDRASMFDEVVFAIVDWSPDRRFLSPFC